MLPTIRMLPTIQLVGSLVGSSQAQLHINKSDCCQSDLPIGALHSYPSTTLFAFFGVFNHAQYPMMACLTSPFILDQSLSACAMTLSAIGSLHSTIFRAKLCSIGSASSGLRYRSGFPWHRSPHTSQRCSIHRITSANGRNRNRARSGLGSRFY